MTMFSAVLMIHGGVCVCDCAASFDSLTVLRVSFHQLQGRSISQSMISVSVESAPLGAAGRA